MSTNYDYLLKASKAKQPPPQQPDTNDAVSEVTNIESPPPSNVPAEETLSQHNSSTKPNERTVEPNPQPNGLTERLSVISELEEGVRETVRATERYSFEIYVDQIEKIEEIQYQYKKKTGKRLSASRIIREALDAYLKQAEEAL